MRKKKQFHKSSVSETSLAQLLKNQQKQLSTPTQDSKQMLTSPPGLDELLGASLQTGAMTSAFEAPCSEVHNSIDNLNCLLNLEANESISNDLKTPTKAPHHHGHHDHHDHGHCSHFGHHHRHSSQGGACMQTPKTKGMGYFNKHNSSHKKSKRYQRSGRKGSRRHTKHKHGFSNKSRVKNVGFFEGDLLCCDESAETLFNEKNFSSTPSAAPINQHIHGSTKKKAKIDESKYKTEMCKNWLAVGYCSYGDKCKFAHGKDELYEKKTVS